jgi:hypothetical protein
VIHNLFSHIVEHEIHVYQIYAGLIRCKSAENAIGMMDPYIQTQTAIIYYYYDLHKIDL